MKIKENGITLNYTQAGKGQPVVLLHGNGSSHKCFNKLIKLLQNQYTVYALDSRCHGKSQKTKELSYTLMAEDTAQFIKILNLKKPILYGFSDGGIIGLIVAYTYPNLLSKLIVSGANLKPSGFKSGILRLIKLAYFLTHSKKLKMMLTQPNITPQQLNNISTPTVVLAGGKDIIKPEHTLEIANNIKNSTLKIFKKESHSSYVLNNKKLYNILKPYL